MHVTIFIGREQEKKDTPIERMKRKFDTLYGRFVYNKRIAIVEPVFGNLRNKGMDRFTLCGKTKVNTQWQLFSLVHATRSHSIALFQLTATFMDPTGTL